ncbi:HAD family hydrolase [Erythrobacter sp. 3-20A1M]|uniref:HAD family hydrolase n=1 Tax=Erythrobacter sp. 3-20A1M TaxID=2653850 RepID=UPI001BFC9689|nr:HAD family hydrolase [Erythrobacter sp. 3-20A1M]QWC56951.1 HAD family hydrolase [Erythrobacter sp. 3-20A1M]
MSASSAKRPLVICDCDEVLLHMVSHFRDWLAETQAIEFRMQGNDFAHAMRWQETGELVEQPEIWRLLGRFFDTEMDRQDPIPGALEAIAEISRHAEVVILTNLLDERRESRVEQLRKFGLEVEVYTNQGPKGPAIADIIERHAPGKTIFIDDLAQHHGSAAETVPDVIRLHLCGEPSLAPHIACGKEAGHAHARIDSWDEALPWILEQLKEDEDA